MKLLRNSALIVIVVLAAANLLSAQTPSSPNAWGYPTGYGVVYGTYGFAAQMQSMYNVARAQQLKRESSSTSSRSNKTAPPPTTVARNHGVFQPVAGVDAGKALADALGETPDEKALIKQIYAATKVEYDKEAAARGWKYNVAGGLTFFTVAAVTVFRDAGEPSEEGVNNYFKAMNLALDEMPSFGSAANKEKQAFNNMLIGFGGLLLAGYTSGKQANDASTVATYQKLAGGLIQLVLQMDPEKIRIKDGQIVFE